jgi:hypothetical protein
LFAENNQTLPISTRQGRILVIFLAHGKQVATETNAGQENNTRRREMERTVERNVIANALVEIYGYEESIPLRAVVASSLRYAALLAMAGNDALYEKLKKALPKVVKNPKTRAQF